METKPGPLFLTVFLLTFLCPLVFGNKLIVVKGFKVSGENQIISYKLSEQIKRIIIRHKKYDCASPLDIRNIITNNYPNEKIDGYDSLEFLERFKSKLSLIYLIDGEINQTEDLFSVRLIIHEIGKDNSYHFVTPLLPLEENNRYVLNSLYHLLQLKRKKEIKVNPLLEKQQELENMENDFIIKREQSRRLMVERNNLQKTLDLFVERFAKFNELASEKEEAESQDQDNPVNQN